MADTDLLNTGLFFCRTGSLWMRNFLHRWWASSDVRWHHEVCWDQTGLCRLLETEGGLGSERPWYSFLGGRRRKRAEHLFVFDCGTFNFKYVNNCGFVFHAVGENELIFSFGRRLFPKRERIYTVVREGYVDGGTSLSFATEEKEEEVGDEHAQGRLREARTVWQAYGVGKAGLRGRPPPVGWELPLQLPSACAGSGAVPSVSFGASGAMATATAVQQQFVKLSFPLVVTAVRNDDQDHSAFSMEGLSAGCGDIVVFLQRCAPMRGTDAADGSPMIRSRVWQLCDYAEGRAPPHSQLSYVDPEKVWRAFAWRPWAEGDMGSEASACDTAVRALSSWRPEFVDEALEDFADVEGDGAALDVEPAGSVTRLHRAAFNAHTLAVVLSGKREFLLVRPGDAACLRPGQGTCDLDHSPCDPNCEADFRPILATSSLISAVLNAGDALLVPGGWWYWARARVPTVTWRQTFSEWHSKCEVAQHVRQRVKQLRLVTQPAPRLVRELCDAVRNGISRKGGHPSDAIVWISPGVGPSLVAGQFASLHFTVYAMDGTPLETSHKLSHPMVMEARPPDLEAREFASGPVALRAVRIHGLLLLSSARAGARCGLLIKGGNPDAPDAMVVVIIDLVDVLERAGPAGSGAGLRVVAAAPSVAAPTQHIATSRPRRGLRAFACAPSMPHPQPRWASHRYLHRSHPSCSEQLSPTAPL